VWWSTHSHQSTTQDVAWRVIEHGSPHTKQSAKAHFSFVARNRELEKMEKRAVLRWSGGKAGVHEDGKLEMEDVNMKREMLTATVQHFRNVYDVNKS
jgi:hypothetical protein